MGYNKETRAKYLEANKIAIAKKKRDYYLDNETKYIAYQKEWQTTNKDYIREFQKNKLSNDNLFKLKMNVKNLIGNSIRKGNFKKQSLTKEILGCSYEELKLHLEAQFLHWMNWDNRGLYNKTPNYGWDIDHITPLATATCYDDIIRLNHYSNLQPLCSYINRHIKKDSLITDIHNCVHSLP